ncbi:tRNA (guanine(9)-N(1))-methyltransferase [Mortierella antarctica]|nr:tRNA (guanine(9)-N(1))-methyltransferase [Mortierella alpina]KAF9988312.1 tRNA (guanine(9)-N(1))-methyltransferase [Mortierella antarctica]
MAEPMPAPPSTSTSDVASASPSASDIPAPAETAPVPTGSTDGQSATTATQASSTNPFWKPRPPPMIGPNGEPLSRNATKKLLKQQQFLERKPQMRAQEKLKRKQKDRERREAIEAGLIAPPPKRQKYDQVQSGITIGIDMSFDEHMLEKEVKSMVDQIKRCYSHNRTCHKIVHLALTSFTGASRDEFTKRANGYELWRNFTIHDQGLEEVWPSEEIPGKDRLEELKRLQVIASAKSEAAKAKALAAAAAAAAASSDSTALSETSESTEKPHADTVASTSTVAPSLSDEEIKALEHERLQKEEKLATVPAVSKVVYLSADSPNTITQLDPGTCYILGGIVDKNRFPNLCQKKAEELGLETAQLPIGDYIKMSSRRVLTVNQVFEILLEFIECKDWKEAFLKVIPQRKLEEKQRIRRGTEAWRKKYGQSADGSNSAASSVAGDDRSDQDHDSEGEGEAEEDHAGDHSVVENRST